ncbi:hypothetical protein ACLOJK_013259 [Asimina triloba]
MPHGYSTWREVASGRRLWTRLHFDAPWDLLRQKIAGSPVPNTIPQQELTGAVLFTQRVHKPMAKAIHFWGTQGLAIIQDDRGFKKNNCTARICSVP